MPLPKHRFPTYDLQLPASELSIKFRPWVSIEHKKILTAFITKDAEAIQNAIVELLDACTFNQLEITKLPVVDFELLFLMVKAKSKGEIVELNYTATQEVDGVDDIIPLELNLNDVQVTPFPNRELFLSGGLGIKMKYPSVETAKLIDQETDEFKKMAYLIEFIFEQDKVYPASEYSIVELAEWLSGLLDTAIEKIVDFFSNLPTVTLKLEFPLGSPPKTKTIELKGLYHFLI